MVDRRGQVIIFVVVAILVVVSIVGIVFLSSGSRGEEKNVELFYSKTSGIDSHVKNVVYELSEDGLYAKGVGGLEEYLDEKVPRNVHLDRVVSSDLTVRAKYVGSEVSVSDAEDFVYVKVHYNIEVSDVENRSAEFDNFEVRVPLVNKRELKTDSSGVVKEDFIAYALNDRARIEIPKGTVALDVDGNAISEVSIRVEKNKFNNHVIYNLGPNGATFNPPIRIVMSYDGVVFGNGLSAKDMGIGQYLDDYDFEVMDRDTPASYSLSYEGIGKYVVPTHLEGGIRVIDSVVDEEKKEISAPVYHFSKFSWGKIVKGKYKTLDWTYEFNDVKMGVCATGCSCDEGTNEKDSQIVNIADAGRYSVFGLVERGQKEGEKCQKQEIFQLKVKGDSSVSGGKSVLREPDKYIECMSLSEFENGNCGYWTYKDVPSSSSSSLATNPLPDGSCENKEAWTLIGLLDFGKGNNELLMEHTMDCVRGNPESVNINGLKLGEVEHDIDYYWIDEAGTVYGFNYTGEDLYVRSGQDTSHDSDGKDGAGHKPRSGGDSVFVSGSEHSGELMRITGDSFFSLCRRKNGMLLAGTYSFPNPDATIYNVDTKQVYKKYKGVGESIFSMLDTGDFWVACEDKGKTFKNNVPYKTMPPSKRWHGAYTVNFIMNHVVFVNAGSVYVDGIGEVLKWGDYHIKNIVEWKDSAYVVGYNYVKDKGCVFKTNDLLSWKEYNAPRGWRFMDAATRGDDKVYLVGTSNYVGGSHHRNSAALFVTEDMVNFKIVKVFKGFDYASKIVSGDGRIVFGVTRGWRSHSSGCELYEITPDGEVKKIATFKEAELRDILIEGDKIIVATRTDKVGGAVYEVVRQDIECKNECDSENEMQCFSGDLSIVQRCKKQEDGCFKLENVSVCDAGFCCKNATCTEDCLGFVCGNGKVESGEECDDGNTVGDDGCSSSCTLEESVCGNGKVESGEECDDGNLFNGDDCSAECRIEG